jgi:replicative DNA helicase
MPSSPTATDNVSKPGRGRGPRLHESEAEKAAEAERILGDVGRSLPFSDEAERGVLSCMLQLPEPTINLAMEKIREEAFYSPGNRLLFATLIEIYNEGKPVDPIHITERLNNRKQLDNVGGASGIASIYDFVPAPSHFDFYADIVRQKHTLRRIITSCSESIKHAYEEQEDISGVLDHTEKRIFSIRMDDELGSRIVPMRDRVMEAIDTIERMITDPEGQKGIQSGYREFDRMTNGLKAGEMIVVAARPSMGKTSLAMNMIEHISVNLGKPTAVFSLEMTSDQLVHRLLCSRGKLSMQNLQGGLLSREDHRRLAQAANELKEATIIIDDTPGLSILELRAKARRYKQMHKIELIAIDYLQLLTSTSRKASDNRQIEIAEISAGIKALSKELGVPIIVLAQLNRAVEQRKGGRPILSDLRESGSIEQDADLVGLLTRENYAGSKSADDEDEAFPEDEGKSLLIVAKHRNGPTGDIHLQFIPEAMRFIDRNPAEDERF